MERKSKLTLYTSLLSLVHIYPYIFLNLFDSLYTQYELWRLWFFIGAGFSPSLSRFLIDIVGISRVPMYVYYVDPALFAVISGWSYYRLSEKFIRRVNYLFVALIILTIPALLFAPELDVGRVVAHTVILSIGIHITSRSPWNNNIKILGTTTNNHADDSIEENSTNELSTVEEHRTAAEAAVETAISAKSSDNLDTAADAYNEALNEYQAAIEALDAGSTEKRTEMEEAVESTRADLEMVKTRQERQSAVIDNLQPAERSLQEAIAAYIENDQTVARIRFRQARDTFEDAHETIAESEVDLLTDPVAVDVQPDRKPSSTTIGDLPGIPEAAASELADAGIEIVDDLDHGDESPWTPAAVQELLDEETIEQDVATTLTLLSWWDGDESYEFDTTEAVETRHQQADYGFNHTS